MDGWKAYNAGNWAPPSEWKEARNGNTLTCYSKEGTATTTTTTTSTTTTTTTTTLGLNGVIDLLALVNKVRDELRTQYEALETSIAAKEAELEKFHEEQTSVSTELTRVCGE